MPQYEMNLRDYWLVIRRRRFIIIAATVLVALFSFWFAKQKVPVYEATSAVKFEQSTTLAGLLVEVLQYSGGDSIETQASLIRSYPILEEVARRMGRLPQTTRGEALRESKSYAAMLDNIAGKLKTQRVGTTSILEVTATSTNPREARDLANIVAEVYRDYNRQARNGRITEARKFIETQLKEVEGRVKQAEDEVWAFREANRIISPGAESSVLLNVFTQIRTDMERTRQQRQELEQTQARLARTDPTSTAERIFVDGGNPALQRLQATQVDLLLERNNLALEVTDKHPKLQAIEDRMRDVRREMRREVGAQIAALRSREEILGRQMGELLQQNREMPAVELNLQRLQRNAKVNDDLLTLLKTRHQEALIKESETVEEVIIIRPASEPTTPVGAESFNTVLVGALLGLMLGLVMAFVQETLDTSIGTIEDVETYLQVPVLGIVPHIDARETMQRLIERRPALAEIEPDALQSHALLITHFDPKSPVAEAYRTLRTNIQFMRMERAGKILVVTSPTLQEGKTTTIVNLAITMAQNGQRTLLVGANLRRPSIHRFFGIDRESGLSDILVGNAQWRECIRTVADILMGRFEMEDIMASPGLDNLHLIESGPVPANPSELLSTPAMSAFLRDVREEYDIVLIDTPPVLPVTDAAIVGAQVDGVVLVYQAGKVGRLVLKRAKTQLEAARANVWGVVLNDVQTEIAGYAYTHYYTHYYGEEAPGPTPGRVQRLWNSLRSRLPGRRDATATEEPEPVAAEAPMEEVAGAAPTGERRYRYRDRVKGLLLILGLSGVIVGLVGWQLGWFDSRPRPQELLRKRLESVPPSVPPALPPAPDSRPVAEPPSAPGATSGAGVPAPVNPASGPVASAPAAMPVAPTAPAAPGAPPSVTPPAAGDGSAVAVVVPPAIAPAPTSGAKPNVEPPTPDGRFAVEFGPFPALPEAERVERQLSQAGFQTVRFRQQAGGGLYAVLVERVPTTREAQALVSTLREQGFGDAVVLAGAEPLNVRVGPAVPLRGAVQLAERLRARGHAVRVAAQPGEAVNFLIRHGNFASRQEAEERADALSRLGLGNHVVRVK